MNDALDAVHGAGHGVGIRHRPEEVPGPRDARRSPLQRPHIVTGRDQCRGDRTTEKPGRARREHDHGALSF